MDHSQRNADSLDEFNRYLAERKPALKRQYEKLLAEDLSRQVLATFQGLIDEFLLFVVDKHRTSCALSNFPDEHKPDKAYVDALKRDIAELWKNFALNLNARFLEDA